MNRILVVDDDLGLRCGREDARVSGGSRSRPRRAGARRWKLAARSTFAAAIVDLCMPTMHGLEIIRSLKAMTPHTGLIVMSGLMSDCGGSPAPDFFGMMADLKGIDRLAKPFGRQELLNLLAG